MFRFLLISVLFVVTLQANVYNVKYHGVTLGEVVNLDTLKSNYLKAEVTNSIAKFMIRKKYFVFHSGDKPDINDAKFKKDTHMMVFAFQQALISKPKYKVYKISDKKTMTLDCTDSKECKFSYVKKGKEKGRGFIFFDDNGEFVKIKEEISTVEISLK
jgi:hypothetical protein